MYVHDLHSNASSAMARHSVKLACSPLHFRALFNVRPHAISGHPFGLECATQPASNCRTAAVPESWSGAQEKREEFLPAERN